MARATAPSRTRILWWGATRRCPRCGRGRLFRRWLTIVPDCPRCALHFEREPGYWIGAMAINITMTSGIFLVGLVIALVLTVPHVPVAPLLAIFVPLALVLPVACFPFSKTIWLAVDRAILQRLDPDERPDEQVPHI
ncbi:MAG: DUF983 domain-containing protein [Thermoplasmata archaeon]|nr:DUF983 domain-containing protein [Thermoplasmata archaeon]